MVFKGRNVSFRKKDRIGFGGNGDVFLIETEDIKYDVVAKFLRFEKGKWFRTKYNRFKNEIKAVETLSEKIDGLLPVIDYYIPSDPREKDCPWYIMPFAKTLKAVVIDNGTSIDIKMRYLREIAEILSNLHTENYAHRDIKLENIFIYENQIKLGDFGLVWHESIDGLTKHNERVGAWTTMAPEMKRSASDSNYPFPADVYSFAKLIWIVLSEDQQCFDGQYEKNKIITLNSRDFKVNTLEDIHDLIERATSHNPAERPDIDECIQLIDNWFATNNDPQKYTRQKIDVLNKKIQLDYEANTTVYDDFASIFDIVKEIINFFYIESVQIAEYYPDKCVKSRIRGCFDINDGRNTYVLKPVELIKERIAKKTESSEARYKYILKIENITDGEVPDKESQRYINIKDMNPVSLLLGSRNIHDNQIIILNEDRNIIFLEKVR